MKITKSQLENIIREELTLVREGGDLQNTAKGAAMELLDTAKVMSQAPSHEPASLYANEVAKQANLIMDALVQMERGAMAEASSLDAGPEYLTQRAKDADLPSGGDPLRQEADALTTMITRLDGMEGFLLNATRHKSDEELTKKAAEKLSALRGTLMQLRGGALRARPESTSSHRMRSED